MGLALSRIILVFSKQSTFGTQTPWTVLDQKHSGTQTSTKFTERLTNFGSVDLSSAETFDQACNICDLYTEKEAVGYCCVCEQYMCYLCCKHHEKISQSENHKIVSKDEFTTLGARTSLFSMHIVTFMNTSLPNCTLSPCNSFVCTHRSELLVSFCWNYFGHTFFLMCPTDKYNSSSLPASFQLKVITKNVVQMTVKSTQKDSIEQQKTVKYFVYKTSREIWQLKYWYNTVYYQKALTVQGECFGVEPFDNGLAISLYIPTGFSLPDWQIQYVDFKGNIKRQIYYDSAEKPLFKKPAHMASNYTEDILYVSDSGNNAIIALGTKGNVIYKFTHSTITCPQGITCDEENNVYVACGKNVIQINHLGKMSRVILNSANKNIKNLYYYKNCKRLAVIDESKTITIFNFISK